MTQERLDDVVISNFEQEKNHCMTAAHCNGTENESQNNAAIRKDLI